MKPAFCTVILVLASVMPGCGEPATSSEETPLATARVVRTQAMEWDNQAPTTRVTGFLRSPTDVLISAEVSGRLIRFPLAEGARVAKGEVIAEFDTTTIKLNVEQARVAVEEMFLNPDQPAASRRARQVELQIAQDLLAKCTLRSPVDGVLNKVWPDVGEWVTAGTVMAQVVGLKQLEFVGSLAEEEAVKARPHQKASVRVDAHPNQTFDAHIARISRAADTATHRFEVTLALANPDEVLWVGMFASARLTLGESTTKRLVIPKTACRERFDEMFCFVAGADNIARRRRIKVVEIPGRSALFHVTDGLKVNDLVVLGPLTGLNDGSPIQVAQ